MSKVLVTYNGVTKHVASSEDAAYIWLHLRISTSIHYATTEDGWRVTNA